LFISKCYKELTLLVQLPIADVEFLRFVFAERISKAQDVTALIEFKSLASIFERGT
jgi:hypothetical protein